MDSIKWNEIQEYIKTHRWKAIPCFSGTDCWCRLIQCEEIPEGGDPDDYTLNNSGSLFKDIAELIVREHNLILTREIYTIDCSNMSLDSMGKIINTEIKNG